MPDSLYLPPPSLPLSPQASGGSGGYVWSCDPDTVGHVTSSGLVTSVAEGMAVVVASDKKNPAHFDKSEVCMDEHVYTPSVIESVYP